MKPMDHAPLPAIRLFLTVEHSCSYLQDRQARNLVADPQAVNQPTYDQLIKLGFRRSGIHLYRPHCQHCQACQSLRIPAHRFRPNRSQRRTWRRNQDLEIRWRPVDYDPEHFQLFDRYLQSRHHQGGMDNPTPDSYLAFISSYWSQTRLLEFRHNELLLMVAVVDVMADGLSAVYTFFDDDATDRGLGTFAILWQLEEARRRQLDYVYLGYWIADCAKMAYKTRFTPYEVFHDGIWQTEAAR